MRLYKLIILLTLSFVKVNGAVTSRFFISDKKTSEIIINRTFVNNDEIRPFSISEFNLKKLAVTGNIYREKVGFLVRILLLDENNKEYLILEAYDEINDSDTINFEDFCQETVALEDVAPVAIKVFVKNASLNLEKLNISYSDNNKISNNQRMVANIDSLKYNQIQTTVNSINKYNKKHKKLWWADITPLSLKNYEEKKRIIGFSDNESTGGIEYYGGGIFEVGEAQNSSTIKTTHSQYVDSFDWRNRHGRNWLTPSKSQENSGYCVPFSVVSVAEALVNLYYNDSINLDLSEQEIACCASRSNPYTYKYGMSFVTGLNYMKNHGTCDEDSYPFVDDSLAVCMSGEVSPKQLVKIGSYTCVGGSATDNIKKALINKGPLVSGIVCTGINHAMTLVGYETIHAGDSLEQIVKYSSNPDSYALIGQSVIPDNDPRIGMTCWIFKDNYPKSRAPRNGYMYVLFHNPNNMNWTYSENYPFDVMNYTDDNIKLEDKDGDGFYFWGLGPKPASCPSCVPDIPDGDDSDSLLGPMDEYGFMENLNPNERDTIFIVNNEITERICNIYNHIVIKDLAIWEVRESIKFHNGASLTIEKGGTLSVKNKAIINNAFIKMNPESNILIEDGSVKILSGKELFIPKNCSLNIKNGSIE